MEICVTGRSTNRPAKNMYFPADRLRLLRDSFPACAAYRSKKCPSAVWALPEIGKDWLEQL